MKRVVIISNSPSDRFREEFKARNVDVLVCHPKRFALTVGTSSILTYDKEVFVRPDFVVTRTGSGPFTPNIIRCIEASGIRVANRIGPILRATDKWQTMLAAAAEGLPIPKTMLVSHSDQLSEWTEFPCIVKIPAGCSCGNGVVLVDTPSRLKAIFDMVKSIDLRQTPLMVQEYLGDRPGVDLRVMVIAGRAIGAMQRTAKKGEFRANLAQGAVGEHVQLTPAIASISEKITQILDLDFAGVDLLFKGDRLVILEVNSSPGLKFERVCNINVVAHIADWVLSRINGCRS
jgi:RimK family alpha-L-glutamate ligase